MKNINAIDVLKGFVKKTGLSERKVALMLGVNPSQFNKWMHGVNTPYMDTLSKLSSNCVELKDYVDSLSINQLSGQITNHTNKGKKGEGLVPFYEIDFAAGEIELIDDHGHGQPKYFIDIPEFSGCTAFRVYNESMEPLIKSGSIVFGTVVPEWNIHLEYGQVYGIVCTDKRRYMKYVRKSTHPDKTLLLVSENSSYDAFEVPRNKIASVWLIHGWVHKRV